MCARRTFLTNCRYSYVSGKLSTLNPLPTAFLPRAEAKSRDTSQLAGNPATLSPVFATLTLPVAPNPFACHSYTKSPGVGGRTPKSLGPLSDSELLTSHHSLLTMSFPLILFRTLLPSPKCYLLSFQPNPHSLRKAPGGWVPLGSFTAHWFSFGTRISGHGTRSLPHSRKPIVRFRTMAGLKPGAYKTENGSAFEAQAKEDPPLQASSRSLATLPSFLRAGTASGISTVDPPLRERGRAEARPYIGSERVSWPAVPGWERSGGRCRPRGGRRPELLRPSHRG
jgi:hypothetical protein